jgi:hypothetical protein
MCCSPIFIDVEAERKGNDVESTRRGRSVNQDIAPSKTLAQIAKEQGKKPLKFDELRRLGRFFPADENVDEVISFIAASRKH